MALARYRLVEKLRLVPACYTAQRWFKGTSDTQAGWYSRASLMLEVSLHKPIQAPNLLWT